MKNMRLILTFTCLTLITISATNIVRAEDPYAFKITQPEDHELSCDELLEEALLMRDIIATTEDIKDETKLKEHGVNAAGALGSLLLGSATGGIGLAAAGFIANHEIEDDNHAADKVQDIAEARRSLMVGLYHGKNCEGSIDYVLKNTPRPKHPTLTQLSALATSQEEGGAEQNPHYNNLHSEQEERKNQRTTAPAQ